MDRFLQSLGIKRGDYAWNLVNFGIGTKDDFKNFTKKEVLSIDGIGPKTITKLEEAGVEFKGEQEDYIGCSFINVWINMWQFILKKYFFEISFMIIFENGYNIQYYISIIK